MASAQSAIEATKEYISHNWNKLVLGPNHSSPPPNPLLIEWVDVDVERDNRKTFELSVVARLGEKMVKFEVIAKKKLFGYKFDVMRVYSP